jgi:hypothetical protein
MVVMMCVLFTGFCGFPLHNKFLFAPISNNYYIDLLYNCVPPVCPVSKPEFHWSKSWPAQEQALVTDADDYDADDS